MNDFQKHTDDELVGWIREDNEQAFTEMYRRYRGVLFVHAVRMLDSEDEAKDLIQELFISLWDRRHVISINTSLSSYLYKSVRNRVLDHIAKRQTEDRHIRSLTLFAEEGACITEQDIREKELAALIEREVSLLPPRMREVFEKSRNEQLSYKEIAEELNISDKTVKKQVSNALEILRKKLDVSLLALICFWSDF